MTFTEKSSQTDTCTYTHTNTYAYNDGHTDPQEIQRMVLHTFSVSFPVQNYEPVEIPGVAGGHSSLSPA